MGSRIGRKAQVAFTAVVACLSLSLLAATKSLAISDVFVNLTASVPSGTGGSVSFDTTDLDLTLCPAGDDFCVGAIDITGTIGDFSISAEDGIGTPLVTFSDGSIIDEIAILNTKITYNGPNQAANSFAELFFDAEAAFDPLNLFLNPYPAEITHEGDADAMGGSFEVQSEGFAGFKDDSGSLNTSLFGTVTDDATPFGPSTAVADPDILCESYDGFCTNAGRLLTRVRVDRQGAEVNLPVMLTLAAGVPEPASALLLGSGLVGLGAYRWLRRRPSS